MKLAVNNIAIVVQSLQKENGAADGRFQGGTAFLTAASRNSSRVRTRKSCAA